MIVTAAHVTIFGPPQQFAAGGRLGTSISAPYRRRQQHTTVQQDSAVSVYATRHLVQKELHVDRWRLFGMREETSVRQCGDSATS